MKSVLLILCYLTSIDSLIAGPKPVSVVFVVPGEGWGFKALPNGAVKGEYGSSPGDSIELPAGTVDFPKLVEFVRASQKKTWGGDAQAEIGYEGATSLSLKFLSDDSFFRAFFLQHRNDWKSWNGGPLSDRLQKLILRIKYYGEAEPALGHGGEDAPLVSASSRLGIAPMQVKGIPKPEEQEEGAERA